MGSGWGYNVGLSYLFESPRVGNANFVAAFDHEFARRIPMYRITHSRDPVPHLPPRYLTGFKYEHVNYEARLRGVVKDQFHHKESLVMIHGVLINHIVDYTY